MSARFAELAWSETPIGQISLRRRRDTTTGKDIYEVKLGDDYLMSSLFTVAEVALADLALARLDGADLRVAVGGLGLGYTAAAALADSRVAELLVIDLLQPIIDWHREGLVPLGVKVSTDLRCRLIQGDFFALSEGPDLDVERPGRAFDAVLLDIDHSPKHLLHEGSAGFYSLAGTARMAGHLRPGGVFAVWSNDPPDPSYVAVLQSAFVDVVAEVISFSNPLQGGNSANTVYLATKGPAQA